ncbi:DUF2092 domain-containing protein [Roseomonas sp. CAU 1739]|uniref:DUF2092 domain-containing protein n=1 Tax=Roseomonas sp. CAU 1739 TaxID=3140364 RepID=UPI00325C26FF
MIAGSLSASAPMSWAQTADEQAVPYRREVMEQALATRQQYELYGIRFDIDQAVIQPASAPLLDDIARAMANLPEWRLRIVGHTDTTGVRERNQALSLERAEAIKAALVQRGVDAGRLTASGAGQDRPVATNDTAQGRALNRRVELVRYTVSPEAQRLLRAMSDYVARQEQVSFDYDATFEIVTEAGQKLGLASSGTVALRRPDRVRATRQGGFADIEMVFDSRTFTLLGRNVNAYMQVQAAGTVDQLVDQLRERYHRPLPAADLLVSNPYDALMSEVFDSKDVGSGVIGGVECDWLAFRTEEVDWQIWIAQGERPYPVRYVITTKGLPNAPQYTIQLRNWRTGTDVATTDFTFQPPAGATSITLEQARERVSELPAHFRRGGRQP